MSRLYDGFPTFVDFGTFPGTRFWEISITPPSMDGGGANDTTTMRNTFLRTKMPKKLKSMGEMKGSGAYDPKMYDDMWAHLNVNQLVSMTFSDGSHLAFWGWLNDLSPNEVVEGAQPTLAFTIIPSNMNASLVETGPTYTAPA